MTSIHTVLRTLLLAGVSVFHLTLGAWAAVPPKHQEEQLLPSLLPFAPVVLSLQAQQAKQALLAKASVYQGQGDPDGHLQDELEALLQRLLAVAPAEATEGLNDRVARVAGAWQQVWGPYDYRSNKRGVDPTTSVDSIFQVVFPSACTSQAGHYYNVMPLRTKQGQPTDKVILLRGVYQLGGSSPRQTATDHLNVRFTNFSGVYLKRLKPPLPTLTGLPALVEGKQLKPHFLILPSPLVKLFLGRGQLQEVYTDDTLRVTYGQSDTQRKMGASRPYLYILTRVEQHP
jgi:hypothetical protein